MDPDMALAHFRTAVRSWHEAVVTGTCEAERDSAREAIEAAAALDAWMCQGGFLPTAWQARRNGLPPAFRQ
jgi:hypothetical protein